MVHSPFFFLEVSSVDIWRAGILMSNDFLRKFFEMDQVLWACVNVAIKIQFTMHDEVINKVNFYVWESWRMTTAGRITSFVVHRGCNFELKMKMKNSLRHFFKVIAINTRITSYDEKIVKTLINDARGIEKAIIWKLYIYFIFIEQIEIRLSLWGITFQFSTFIWGFLFAHQTTDLKVTLCIEDFISWYFKRAQLTLFSFYLPFILLRNFFISLKIASHQQSNQFVI
jgi:hypothetical protein